NFAVDLAGWQIKDQVGAIKTYPWPENSPLKAKGFLVVNRTQSKIVLQNNGDGLTLVNPQGVVADQITYPASPANQSYNRANNGWVWSRILTPGQPNEIDKVSAAVQQKIAQKNQTAALSTTTTQTSLGTTALSAQINQFTPSINWLSRIFTFLLGLAIAAASAAVVVFLRKKQIK
ncbi:MAG: lamin tail domain-containing protein, partial [Patescibacteria group bacterium]